MKKILKKIEKCIHFFKKKLYFYLATKSLGKFEKPLRINYKCVFTKNTFLGSNCNFNGIRIDGDGLVKIGNNFHSGKEIIIFTQNHNYDDGKSIPYDETYKIKSVLIGDNVWIGTRALILPGAEIGEGAVIQAGSVVSGKIPALSIAGGNPAKVFKKRNEKHYLKLKKEKRFH